jgi:hypothetical protein
VVDWKDQPHVISLDNCTLPTETHVTSPHPYRTTQWLGGTVFPYMYVLVLLKSYFYDYPFITSFLDLQVHLDCAFTVLFCRRTQVERNSGSSFSYPAVCFSYAIMPCYIDSASRFCCTIPDARMPFLCYYTSTECFIDEEGR